MATACPAAPASRPVRSLVARLWSSVFAVLWLWPAQTHAQGLPPLPAGWPSQQVEIGLSDSPNGAAAMKATTSFAFRYQYLAGGVNTGNGWATWNTNGDFPRFYIQESIAAGITPVFTYYMLLQSLPAGGSESDADFTNANNTATMTAFYNDLILFFQKAALFPNQKVILHVEPDFWGYMEQRSSGDNAATVSARVSETGIAALAGLPSTVAGMAQAFNVSVANGGAWGFHNMHLQAGVANGTLVEHHYLAVELCRQIFNGLPEPKDGFFTMPEAPGLGFEPNRDAIREIAKLPLSQGRGKG